ncbi:MAG: hypothetical protein PGN07_03360 [Aeromicrobium erythreum]
MASTRDVLLVGSGSLGSAVGRLLVADDRRVVALRRRAELVPTPLVGRSVDLTADDPELDDLDVAELVVALTARPRSEESYRATYVDGMTRALDALPALPDRAVLVSSTGVVGEQDPAELVTEDTPPAPGDGPAGVLLEAEQVFHDRVPHGVVLRLSGLYGRGSTYLQDRVRDGRIDDPHRWTNRIHRDDAAAAVVHLLGVDDPAPLYLGTDDEPAQLGAVAAYLATLLGAPAPPQADPAQGHGKRLSNARLRATGWVPRYPTFREGYAAELADRP